jgi:hypothetical protein
MDARTALENAAPARMSHVGYLRVYSDANGVSHFDPVVVELTPTDYAPPAPPIWISPVQAAVRTVFSRVNAGWYGDWHPSPTRQFYVQLQGVVEVRVSDGELRRIEPGMVLLLEDMLPPGHVSRVAGDEDSVGFFVHLGMDCPDDEGHAPGGERGEVPGRESQSDRDMKMQPERERSRRHRGVLKA